MKQQIESISSSDAVTKMTREQYLQACEEIAQYAGITVKTLRSSYFRKYEEYFKSKKSRK